MLLEDNTHLQLVGKPWRCNAQFSDCSQQYYIINLKVAKRLDINCLHQERNNNSET